MGIPNDSRSQKTFSVGRPNSLAGPDRIHPTLVWIAVGPLSPLITFLVTIPVRSNSCPSQSASSKPEVIVTYSGMVDWLRIQGATHNRDYQLAAYLLNIPRWMTAVFSVPKRLNFDCNFRVYIIRFVMNIFWLPVSREPLSHCFWGVYSTYLLNAIVQSGVGLGSELRHTISLKYVDSLGSESSDGFLGLFW